MNTLGKFLKGEKENEFYGRNIPAIHRWGKPHHFGKWKKMVKNGEMAMTNMTLGDFWEALFGSPDPEKIVAMVAMPYFLLAEQEFSLDNQVSTNMYYATSM